VEPIESIRPLLSYRRWVIKKVRVRLKERRETFTKM
jgi:hypothetical protein